MIRSLGNQPPDYVLEGCLGKALVVVPMVVSVVVPMMVIMAMTVVNMHRLSLSDRQGWLDDPGLFRQQGFDVGMGPLCRHL